MNEFFSRDRFAFETSKTEIRRRYLSEVVKNTVKCFVVPAERYRLYRETNPIFKGLYTSPHGRRPVDYQFELFEEGGIKGVRLGEIWESDANVKNILSKAICDSLSVIGETDYPKERISSQLDVEYSKPRSSHFVGINPELLLRDRVDRGVHNLDLLVKDPTREIQWEAKKAGIDILEIEELVRIIEPPSILELLNAQDPLADWGKESAGGIRIEEDSKIVVTGNLPLVFGLFAIRNSRPSELNKIEYKKASNSIHYFEKHDETSDWINIYSIYPWNPAVSDGEIRTTGMLVFWTGKYLERRKQEKHGMWYKKTVDLISAYLIGTYLNKVDQDTLYADFLSGLRRSDIPLKFVKIHLYNLVPTMNDFINRTMSAGELE